MPRFDVKAEFGYRIIVALALGGEHTMAVVKEVAETRSSAAVPKWIRLLLKFARHPRLQKMAELLVLTYAERLANGDPVDPRMRKLIAAWCARRTKNGVPGRPSNTMKAIAVQYAFLSWTLKEPSLKREVIIESLAPSFGIKRRRMFELVKGLDRRGPTKTN